MCSSDLAALLAALAVYLWVALRSPDPEAEEEAAEDAPAPALGRSLLVTLAGFAVLLVSARTGEGLDAWLDWLLQPLEAPAEAAAPAADELARLKARVAELTAASAS